MCSSVQFAMPLQAMVQYSHVHEFQRIPFVLSAGHSAHHPAGLNVQCEGVGCPIASLTEASMAQHSGAEGVTGAVQPPGS